VPWVGKQIIGVLCLQNSEEPVMDQHNYGTGVVAIRHKDCYAGLENKWHLIVWDE